MKATRQQQKMFFALCHRGSWDKNKMELKAMSLYHLKSFAEITSAQIAPLIDAMQKKIHVKEREHSVNIPLHARVFDTKTRRMLYSEFARVGQEQGVVMYFPLSYSVNRKVHDEKELDIMVGSGKMDIKGTELFDFDVFITRDRQKWMVERDQNKLMWVAVNMDNNETKPLGEFKKVKIIGNVYEEIAEQLG